jgi:hypothetical protein
MTRIDRIAIEADIVDVSQPVRRPLAVGAIRTQRLHLAEQAFRVVIENRGGLGDCGDHDDAPLQAPGAQGMLFELAFRSPTPRSQNVLVP